MEIKQLNRQFGLVLAQLGQIQRCMMTYTIALDLKDTDVHRMEANFCEGSTPVHTKDIHKGTQNLEKV